MENCNSNTYIVSHVDMTKSSLSVPTHTLITDEYDIAVIGKTRKEYGEIFNENTLHILENFACPEDPNSDDETSFPHFNSAYGVLLERPTEGQTWYNKTTKSLNVYDGKKWLPILGEINVQGKRGVLSHGQTIPMLTNQSGGLIPYDKCAMIVSPYEYIFNISSMICTVSSEGVITMEYYREGTNGQVVEYGDVNYQIVAVV